MRRLPDDSSNLQLTLGVFPCLPPTLNRIVSKSLSGHELRLSAGEMPDLCRTFPVQPRQTCFPCSLREEVGLQPLV